MVFHPNIRWPLWPYQTAYNPVARSPTSSRAKPQINPLLSRPPQKASQINQIPDDPSIPKMESVK